MLAEPSNSGFGRRAIQNAPCEAAGPTTGYPAGFSEQPKRPAKPAFTLLELVVVIAILDILAALLLPALARAKAKAQQTICIGNFRQLTTGWKMFADDNGGRLVSVSYFINPKTEVNSNAWVRGSMDDDQRTYPPIQPGVWDSTNLAGLQLGSLYNYNPLPGVYRCPADPSTIAGRPRVRSYSLNDWMGGTTVYGQHEYKVFRHEADIITPNPAAAWVFIDEHERSINDGWFAVDMVGNKGMLDAPATRHANAYALSLADGHVEVWRLHDGRTMRWSNYPFPITRPIPTGRNYRPPPLA